MDDRISQAGVWWSDITGPRSMIEILTETLSDLRSVRLELPVDCPWPAEMRSCAEACIRNGYGLEDLSLEIVGNAGNEPLDYLLERFARSDDRRNYRSSFDPQTYLRGHEVIKGKVIWVIANTVDEATAWSDFASRWKPNSATDGLFVIESSCEIARSAHETAGQIRTIDYASRVSDYSVSLFNGGLSDMRSDRGTHASKKRYQAALLTHVCERDVEVSEALSERLEEFVREPLEAIGEVEALFDSGHGSSDESHILTLWRRGRIEEIERRVWAAQVEVLFPLIETLRLSIVEDLTDKLSDLLDDEGLHNHGERPSCIEDIELGSLVYLMAADKLEVHSAAQKNEIHLLRSCRNNIAHRRPCPWEDVQRLLELAE
ncbi:hypothetical protein [Paratractidigestivibacter sp.]|uniref:hypothetical protein n=1 Tax=Paratractidigestivibacter sp. TaxID=2847316 RepID=UPI002AC8DF84|nr:hypothetical protein [Paratractidigestivibacter sp.]